MLLLSILSPLFPLFTGWKNKRSYMWIYALLGIGTDLAVYLSKHYFHTSYYWMGNLFLLSEFLLISFYFRSKIFKSSLVFLGVNMGICIFYILYMLLSTSYADRFNYTASSLFNLYYILLTIAGFYVLIKEAKLLPAERSSFFWVNTALLVYSAGNFFIFLLRNKINHTNPEIMLILWSAIFLSLNIAKNLLLGIAFLQQKSSRTPLNFSGK